MYTINTEEQLMEFVKLLDKSDPAIDITYLWVEAGGRDDAYRFVSCSWCGERWPYEVVDPADEKRANDEANAHALTCEKDPRIADLSRLTAEVAELRAALKPFAKWGAEQARWVRELPDATPLCVLTTAMADEETPGTVQTVILDMTFADLRRAAALLAKDTQP